MTKLFAHKMERSDSSHAILESSSRKRKAAKIHALLETVTNCSDADLLDIGTGSGDIAHELAGYCKTVSSVDITDERKSKKGYTFKQSDDETIPFPDASFDIVVTNHVIEHTPDQAKHVREVQRVLKPGGWIYLATPNKYWLSDPHYKLPFISWLPRSLGTKYLDAVQGATWDIYPVSHLGIKKYFAGYKIQNAIPKLLHSSAAEKLDTWKFATKIAKIAPSPALNLAQYASPTIIYLMQKPE